MCIVRAHDSTQSWKEKWEKSIAFQLTCKASSGVEIIPPQRVTRARANELLQRTTSSRSIWSAIALIAGFDTRIARINSLNNWNSRFNSFINRFWSLISFFKSTNFWFCEWITARNSRMQLWSLNSSLGIMEPQPRSHGNGFFGLCSHSSRWLLNASNFSICVHP